MINFKVAAVAFKLGRPRSAASNQQVLDERRPKQLQTLLEYIIVPKLIMEGEKLNTAC